LNGLCSADVPPYCLLPGRSEGDPARKRPRRRRPDLRRSAVPAEVRRADKPLQRHGHVVQAAHWGRRRRRFPPPSRGHLHLQPLLKRRMPCACSPQSALTTHSTFNRTPWWGLSNSKGAKFKRAVRFWRKM
jgi:hypothetical protein